MYSPDDVQILLQSCDFDYNRFCQIVRCDVKKDLMFIQSKHSIFLIDWFLLFEKMNKLNFWIRCIQKNSSTWRCDTCVNEKYVTLEEEKPLSNTIWWKHFNRRRTTSGLNLFHKPTVKRVENRTLMSDIQRNRQQCGHLLQVEKILMTSLNGKVFDLVHDIFLPRKFDFNPIPVPRKWTLLLKPYP